MKTLIINTYGGSLLLGTRALGIAEITGSYEDAGFGTPIQRANFPEIETIARLKDWPQQDLSETVVLAHPPCSAFSVQNNSETARGTNSEAFACTKRVLDYTMSNRVLAVAVESVTGALSGAWEVHQAYADRRDYDLFRILQSGSMFAPQWRERFWAVWMRRGAVSNRELKLRLAPTFQTVAQAVGPHEDGPECGNTGVLLGRLKEKLLEAGCTDDDMSFFFDAGNHPQKTQSIMRAFQRRIYADDHDLMMTKEVLGNFGSGQLCYLEPSGLAPCVMGGSWFYMNGRNLSEAAYKRIMGFPHDYIFPGSSRRSMRVFLSKGVIPAVATWVLGQIFTNLGVSHATDCTCHGCKPGSSYELVVEANHIADFRYNRRHWGVSSLPPIRGHSDEDRL